MGQLVMIAKNPTVRADFAAVLMPVVFGVLGGAVVLAFPGDRYSPQVSFWAAAMLLLAGLAATALTDRAIGRVYTRSATALDFLLPLIALSAMGMTTVVLLR
ncbi:hypothetical protein [Nocardia farcinica]|uniref:hypothetical protein n=1 Tax=Nocardia farcinica TaxID=37329 RepID=UPI0024571E7E|nr:hypothetical protein [Nocardia farcinica]